MLRIPLVIILVAEAFVQPTLSFSIVRQNFDEVDFYEINDRDSFVNESTITYQLFTRLNPTEPQILTVGDVEALDESNFNPSLPTKIFSHGWRGSPGSGYSSRDGYLLREECNFISVNWSDMATGPLPYPSDYPYIVEVNVPKVGKNLGALIDFLVERTNAAISSFHLIGHSLGAHVAGWAGASVTSGRISRITGLDPAGPFFPLNDTESRLDISDAEFVDIIHTDSGDLTGNALGMEEPIGHIDFYPNGGVDQPGCIHIGNQTEPSVYQETRNGCDHGRAPIYFAESITSEIGFRAVECDSLESFKNGLCNGNPLVLMGDPTPSSARGLFYLLTDSEPPFALG